MSTAPKPQPIADPVKLDPKHYKVDFENDRVRVLRISYGPREKSVMHSHPDSMAVFSQRSTLTLHTSRRQNRREPLQGGPDDVVAWWKPPSRELDGRALRGALGRAEIAPQNPRHNFENQRGGKFSVNFLSSLLPDFFSFAEMERRGGSRSITLRLSGSTHEKQQNQCADYRQDNKTPYEALRGHFHRGEC